MNVKISVPEVVEIFKEIQEQLIRGDYAGKEVEHAHANKSK
jgi:hypothetical protein